MAARIVSFGMTDTAFRLHSTKSFWNGLASHWTWLKLELWKTKTRDHQQPRALARLRNMLHDEEHGNEKPGLRCSSWVFWVDSGELTHHKPPKLWEGNMWWPHLTLNHSQTIKRQTREALRLTLDAPNQRNLLMSEGIRFPNPQLSHH